MPRKGAVLVSCAPGSGHAPGLLVDALNEPVFATTNGRRRKITKREAIVTQLVDESAGEEMIKGVVA